MGTPEFALISLQRLVERGYNVVGVVTMPDKPVGRHHDTLSSSPVKQYAVAHGLPVLQPERLRDEAFLSQLRQLQADVQVVVAFRMLPEVVWAMPPRGTFNLHAALLPKYRGAAPINWAVINGEQETGVTTFFLDHDIDTGAIIHQQRVPIGDADCVGDVYDRLALVGADLVCRTLDDIAAGTVRPIPQEQLPQPTPQSSTAPKLFKDTCRIEWAWHTARTARNFIRGLSPYPGAWTTLRYPDGREVVLKVFAAEVAADTDVPASLREVVGSPLAVRFADGLLCLTDIQVAGKRRMAAADFLRGARLEGATLG